MSQRTSRKVISTNENILYELNDYDRQRKPQTLIDDDRIQCVPADPILKSLSVREKKKSMNKNFDNSF
jgi:hypothetical protein